MEWSVGHGIFVPPYLTVIVRRTRPGGRERNPQLEHPHHNLDGTSLASRTPAPGGGDVLGWSRGRSARDGVW
jgi:hypothetical protein